MESLVWPLSILLSQLFEKMSDTIAIAVREGEDKMDVIAVPKLSLIEVLIPSMKLVATCNEPWDEVQVNVFEDPLVAEAKKERAKSSASIWAGIFPPPPTPPLFDDSEDTCDASCSFENSSSLAKKQVAPG